MKTRVVLGLMLLAGCGAQPTTSVSRACVDATADEVATIRSLLQTYQDEGLTKRSAMLASGEVCAEFGYNPDQCFACLVAIVDEVYR